MLYYTSPNDKYPEEQNNHHILKLGGKFIDVLTLSDSNIIKLLNNPHVVWDVTSAKLFDIHLSKTLLTALGLSYPDLEILQSLYNYNNVWYNTIKKNEDTINNIWTLIYNHQDVVFKKKYNNYKIVIAYIYTQAIIECFYNICQDLKEVSEPEEAAIRLSGWINNYDLVNSGYKVFKKFTILLALMDIHIDKNAFERGILYIIEILCLNKQMLKTIMTKKDKSQVYFKVKNFDYQHGINFKISMSKATCFEFENNIYKIEKSIYSINDAIHADTPLQEKPTLNIDAVMLADCTEYKVNKNYLQITKGVIKKRLHTANKNWDSVLNKQYLKDTAQKIKKLHKKLTVAAYVSTTNVEYTTRNRQIKQQLQDLVVQFAKDWSEFETISLLMYLENEINAASIYFIFFLDFRGRIYTISTYGPISNKIIRNILVYNNPTHDTDTQCISDQSVTFQTIKNNYFNKLNSIQLSNNSDTFKSALFWVLLSLASHYKSKLLKNNQIPIDTLLEIGIEIYRNKDQDRNDLTIDEEVELRRNSFIIDQLVLGILDSSTFLCKDSTASVFQHLFIYLQPKNTEALKICNIVGSDSWYDPYSTIINRFLESVTADDFVLQIFNRKTLKKSIMTHPYSVTYFSSWNYFLTEVNKQLTSQHKITFGSLDIEKQDNIKNLFKAFFSFLSKNFEVDIFYKKNSQEIKKIKQIQFDDGTRINFNYLILQNNRREIKNKKLNLRISYNENVINSSVDTKQTELAIRANLIHATDSYFARSVILNFKCLTIHDCFCLKLQDINACIDYMNGFFRKEIFKNANNDNTSLTTNDLNIMPYSLTVVY